MELGMAYTDELCAPYERKRLETGVVQHMSTNTGQEIDTYHSSSEKEQSLIF